MSYLQKALFAGVASELLTSTGIADVTSAAPTAGQVLLAAGPTDAGWETQPDGLFATTGSGVAIDSATPSANDVLTASGATAAAFGQHYGKTFLYRNATLSLTSGWQDVVMDTASLDIDGLFDAASGGVKVKAAGIYLALIRVRLESKINKLIVGVQRRGSGTWTAISGADFVLAGGYQAASGAAVVYAAAVNDIIIGRVYASASIGVDETSTETHFHVIGPL